MSEVKRYRIPRLDDPLSWPRDLRRIGTEIVLASDYDKLEAELTKLRTERDRLREALSHYADKRNWRRNYDGTGHLNVFQADTDGPYIIAFAALHSTRQEEVEE